ncbi:MAG TPA: hypothetical protein VHJ34_03180 [Actinomycetota bacterium]|nr:hypothetical protein [Actinomycetota bacterium]
MVSYNPCGRIATSFDVPNLVVPNGPGICTAIERRERDRGRPAPERGPSIGDLVAIARDRAVALAPWPEIATAPSRIGLTGLESYFWLEDAPGPIAATASAGGVTVTAEARPARYEWSFGDGGGVTSDGPGRPWTRRAPGDVAHLYETKDVYDVVVDVVWEARWRVDGGAWQPLGVFVTSGSRDYPVQELVSVLVPDE